MVIICHNTDNGDGWEREGEFKYYFSEFSEKKAYPLGINIVFYAAVRSGSRLFCAIAHTCSKAPTMMRSSFSLMSANSLG